MYAHLGRGSRLSPPPSTHAFREDGLRLMRPLLLLFSLILLSSRKLGLDKQTQRELGL